MDTTTAAVERVIGRVSAGLLNADSEVIAVLMNVAAELRKAQSSMTALAAERDSLRLDAIRHYAMRAQFGGYGPISANLPRVYVPMNPDQTYATPEAYQDAIDAAVKDGSFPGTVLKEPT